MTREFMVGHLSVQIWQDTDAQSPREWDNLAKLSLLHSSVTINETDIAIPQGTDPLSVRPLIEERYNPVAILPLWYYDHSGMSITARSRNWPFDDAWDSGLLGWAFVPWSAYIEEYGQDTPENRADALERARSEIDTLDMWLKDEVYGYDIIRFDGSVIDSCGGFYGAVECKAQAEEAAQAIIAAGDQTQTAVSSEKQLESMRQAVASLDEKSKRYGGDGHEWKCYSEARGIITILLASLENVRERLHE